MSTNMIILNYNIATREMIVQSEKRRSRLLGDKILTKYLSLVVKTHKL